MIGIIRIYQNIFSPLKFYLFGPSCRCRFRVTCSNYAVQMYKTHNCLVATYLTIKRILHCNPFSEVEDE
ncbi:MAG: membrane protein insertion efficiency factor YidD [Opitutales bacterium]|nr:membrane protein insertion efficiency factor YidD [Opitutales bacterium]